MGLVDWSDAQTSPIESFARPLVMIVPEPLKSRPWPSSAEEVLRRELFFRIFRDCEVENHRQEDGISQVQDSVHCIIAGILDNEAILGHSISRYLLIYPHSCLGTMSHREQFERVTSCEYSS